MRGFAVEILKFGSSLYSIAGHPHMSIFAPQQNQPRQQSSANLTRANKMSPAANHADDTLHLQRTIGNQAVLRLLQARANVLEAGSDTEVDSETPATAHFAHDFSRIPVHAPAPITIQPKLAINTPGDIYEQEADHIADNVMRMPEPQLQRACACGGGCPRCQTEQPSQEHQRLQTKHVGPSDSGQTAAPPIVHEVLSSPGQPLDPSTRAFMEPRFGHDFSHVRVHSEGKAPESARSVNALAYTLGQDLAFASGQYAPASFEGRRLLAHELVHVVQQSGSFPLDHRLFDRTDHETAVQEGTPPLLSGRHLTRLQRQPATAAHDLWENYKDIPREYHPVLYSDGMPLLVIVSGFREGVRIRHDFQTALAHATGDRRLHSAVTWESEFVKRIQDQQTAGSTAAPALPTLAELAEEHKKIENDTEAEIASLNNTELKKFLSAHVNVLFPDIGFSSKTGEALQRLPAPKSVLESLDPVGAYGADLVRLLLRPRSQSAFYW